MGGIICREPKLLVRGIHKIYVGGFDELFIQTADGKIMEYKTGQQKLIANRVKKFAHVHDTSFSLSDSNILSYNSTWHDQVIDFDVVDYIICYIKLVAGSSYIYLEKFKGQPSSNLFITAQNIKTVALTSDRLFYLTTANELYHLTIKSGDKQKLATGVRKIYTESYFAMTYIKMDRSVYMYRCFSDLHELKQITNVQSPLDLSMSWKLYSAIISEDGST